MCCAGLFTGCKAGHSDIRKCKRYIYDWSYDNNMWVKIFNCTFTGYSSAELFPSFVQRLDAHKFQSNCKNSISRLSSVCICSLN